MDSVKSIGTRAEVMHGNAKRTSGRLTKSDLKYNKHGRIVSRKKSTQKNLIKRLTDQGYHTCKGFFGTITTPSEMDVECKSRKTRRRRNV
jgi:regulator of replication initiation timing